MFQADRAEWRAKFIKLNTIMQFQKSQCDKEIVQSKKNQRTSCVLSLKYQLFKKRLLLLFHLHGRNLHAALGHRWLKMQKSSNSNVHQCVFLVPSLRARDMWGRPGPRGLGWALIGAKQHLVLGGLLCAPALLLHQELFEAAWGECEGLSS